MKTLSIFLVCICAFSNSNAQVSELLGTWNIIEFSVTNGDNSNKKSEAQLNEEGSIWDLFILENGKFKQTSNMRTGESKSHEGTWKVLDNKLTFILLVNNQNIELVYNYKFENNVLILIRSNPSGTMKIISKFIKK